MMWPIKPSFVTVDGSQTWQINASTDLWLYSPTPEKPRHAWGITMFHHVKGKGECRGCGYAHLKINKKQASAIMLALVQARQDLLEGPLPVSCE